MRKALLAAMCVLGLYAPASAQVVAPNVTGNECWNAGQGPGGPNTGFLCTYMLRNGQALSIISGSGAFTTQATVQQSMLEWHGTAPTSWTVTTPPNPFDGEMIILGTDTTLTSLVTLNANTGQSLSASFTGQTISATTSVMYQYNYASTTWYRIR